MLAARKMCRNPALTDARGCVVQGAMAFYSGATGRTLVAFGKWATRGGQVGLGNGNGNGNG